MSLVREQIEKVFVISLLLDDPDKWIPIYFKDDLRRFYKYQFLVLEEERKSLPRFQVDKDKREKILENLKNNADLSDLEKELIEHKFTQPGVPIATCNWM
jgi:phosphoglycerate-specific signal transduction histidine kinase